jgi:hypothetical protein
MKGFVQAAMGFAADAQGSGVVYVRLTMGAAPRVLRVPFRVKRYPALHEREVGYAALFAAAEALRRRGIERVCFAFDDEQLARDLREHREVPAPLALAYVQVRCALNQFKEYDIAADGADNGDLVARARSETAMHAAA